MSQYAEQSAHVEDRWMTCYACARELRRLADVVRASGGQALCPRCAREHGVAAKKTYVPDFSLRGPL